MAHQGHQPTFETPAGKYGEEDRMRGRGKSLHKMKRGKRRIAKRKGGKRS